MTIEQTKRRPVVLKAEKRKGGERMERVASYVIVISFGQVEATVLSRSGKILDSGEISTSPNWD